MTTIKLAARAVQRVWGRHVLPTGFGHFSDGLDEPIGEIWYEAPSPATPDLLVKYLFTSERLSIQVHPDNAAARARGHRCGKDEAWLVIAAEPDAVIGLGLRATVSRDRLRAAALDGSIEGLIDWRPVKAGDFFYSAAGTVHAIGGGVSLIEVQQNLDLTYRLYDYGRPRELHLDDAVAVALPEPWQPVAPPREIARGRQVLAEGNCFVVERWTTAGPLTIDGSAGDVVLILVGGGPVDLDDIALTPGDVAVASGSATLRPHGDADLMVAYGGGTVRPGLLKP